MNIRKVIIPAFLSIYMTVSTTVVQANVIDSIIKTEHVASGIEYESVERLTTNGFVYINQLVVDLDNPNVDFDILRNSDKFGYQTNLTNLIGDTSDTNVVGAVNGSFFFMDTTPTDVIGYEYNDDQWVFMKEGYNKAKLEENSVIISKDNEVSFDYLQANTILHNSRGESVRLVTVNGNRDLIHLTLVSPYMMKDTSKIDALGNVYKFVIQDGYITYIAKPKEIINIPEGGYVLTVNNNSFEKMNSMFPVGEQVTLQLSTNFDSFLDDTKLLLSGAGTLLKDGQVKLDGLSASPTSRQPRTALGVSADGNTLYVVAVDGRGKSIGMTNNELAEYMLSLGVTNAINLDGGGSTTFAVRPEGDTQAKVVNTVSDGAERKVINGFGVLTSETKELNSIKITSSIDKVLVGEKVKLTAYGLDENDNPITIDSNAVVYNDTTNPDNISTNGYISFNEPGVKIINGTYNGINGVVMVEVFGDEAVVEIEPMNVGVNSRANINIMATTPKGDKIPVDAAAHQFTFSPNIVIENGVVITGAEKGTAQISTVINGKTVTQTVSIGASDVYKELSSFENMKITSKPYPNGNEGATGVYKEKAMSGNYAIKTSFNFKANGKAQAVYSILDNVKINDTRAEKLAVNYFGDNKGNSVKAILKDAKGTEKVVIFTDSVNFNGYKRLETNIPKGLVYPVTVERLYVASTGKSAISGVGYFDYLTYTIGNSYEMGLNNIDLSYDSSNNVSNTSPVFTVNAKIDSTINKYYETKVYDNTKVINVSADNGGLTSMDSSYYGKIRNELNNSSQKNIVIVSSQSVTPNTFSISQEGTMLKNMLEGYIDKYDKNVYYVNKHANSNVTTLENKIRYINLYNKNVQFSLDSEGNLSYKSIN